MISSNKVVFVMLLALIAAFSGCLGSQPSSYPEAEAWWEGMSSDWRPAAQAAHTQVVACSAYCQAKNWSIAPGLCRVAELAMHELAVDLVDRNVRDLDAPESFWSLWRAARDAVADGGEAAVALREAAQIYGDDQASNESLQYAEGRDREGAIALVMFLGSWSQFETKFDEAERQRV